MNTWILTVTWVGFEALHLLFGGYSFWRGPPPDQTRRFRASEIAAYASVLPLLTLLLFIRVFVIGRSSQVAQLAGDSGFELWRLWTDFWPLFFFSSPIVFLITLVAALLPPYPSRFWPSFVCRFCAVVSASCACYTVIVYFPDA